MKTKAILIKQISFVLLIAIGAIFTSGCDITTKQQISSVISNVKESPEVIAVRKLPMEDGVILGDLIDTGLVDTVWKIYDPAENGNKYVTISGNVLYKDKLITVKIQYQMYDDEKIKFTAMTYNDVPQNEKSSAEMFRFLKKEYEAKHIIEK